MVVFAEAVRTTFDREGVGVLEKPQCFLRCVIDLCDEGTAERALLERNCDAKFLSPFARACKIHTEVAVNAASLNAQALLINERGEDAEAAQAVCSAIGAALIQSLISDNKGQAQKASVLPSQLKVAEKKDEKEDAVGKESLNKRKRSVVIVFVACLVIVGIVVCSLLAANSHTAVFIDDENGAQIEASSLFSGSITIPANATEYEGHTFVGWALDGKVYKPNESFPLRDNVEFVAVWDKVSHAITFDGNGADGGSVQAMECEHEEYISLPACSFTRKFFKFDAWECDGKQYKQGDGVQVNADMEFKATWVHDVGTSLKVEQFFTDRNELGELLGAVLVRNVSNDNLYVKADFTYKDVMGNQVGTDSDTTHGLIAPGELSIIVTSPAWFTKEMPSVATIDYELSIDENAYKGEEPLSSSVSIRELSCSDNSIQAEVTNNSDNETDIYKALVFADGKQYGNWALLIADVGKLAPKESKTVTFESLGGNTGLTYCERQFFLYQNL